MTIDWSLPYPSRREAILAHNVVATSQPLAAQAGLEMLRIGGNAVDAALASAIALTVVEPCANGIGADAFALVGDGEEIHGLNASGKSPSNYDGSSIEPTGWSPVTVPGAVSSWVALSEKFGTVDFELLFAPAIRYATEGFLVSRQTAAGWARGAARYNSFDSWRATFLPNGTVPNTGEHVILPDHGTTLQEIAETRGESFYRGRLAQEINNASVKEGGWLRAKDLDAHRCQWIKPLGMPCGSCELLELPPNGQGIAALLALGIVQHCDVCLEDCDAPEVLHVQIEAMKYAFADTHAFVADPVISGNCEDLLHDDRVTKYANGISSNASLCEKETIPRYSSTVYVAAGDARGQLVSLIQSNFEGFGSGIVIPGTGIAMQNRGMGFSHARGHPNVAEPSKRPFHTIIPAMLKDQTGAKMAFGVMGGPMQPQGHLQVVSRIVFGNQNPQAALDAPRWKLLGGRKVAIERGFADSVYEGLHARGHELELAERTVAFGGGQAVYRLEHGLAGASDQRRDGQAVGF
ncbi:MAG: gamma-glutamyltransferase family protein [Phycisphaerales bacterium]|jgi:gamma-glutamyltranspeptidase/glutathione hydrolase|nr:gamma-glutamyltransferase family protein [Phycisphaerales bacterium]